MQELRIEGRGAKIFNFRCRLFSKDHSPVRLPCYALGLPACPFACCWRASREQSLDEAAECGTCGLTGGSFPK